MYSGQVCEPTLVDVFLENLLYTCYVKHLIVIHLFLNKLFANILANYVQHVNTKYP